MDGSSCPREDSVGKSCARILVFRIHWVPRTTLAAVECIISSGIFLESYLLKLTHSPNYGVSISEAGWPAGPRFTDSAISGVDIKLEMPPASAEPLLAHAISMAEVGCY